MGISSLFKPAKEVPHTWWSSDDPMETRPRLNTMLMLCAGLWIFGTGDAVLVAAGIGNSPWTVLADGISVNIDRSIGQTTLFVSIAVLFLWVPLREKPGIGTILNAVLIAAAIEYMLPMLPTPDSFALAFAQVVLGVILVGIGSGLYLTANLGPGPRDGWMTGIQRRTGIPIGRVRAAIEVSVVVAGWLLGGTVGWGTVAFALLIGPVVAVCLNLAGSVGNISEQMGE